MSLISHLNSTNLRHILFFFNKRELTELYVKLTVVTDVDVVAVIKSILQDNSFWLVKLQAYCNVPIYQLSRSNNWMLVYTRLVQDIYNYGKVKRNGWITECAILLANGAWSELDNLHNIRNKLSKLIIRVNAYAICEDMYGHQIIKEIILQDPSLPLDTAITHTALTYYCCYCVRLF